MMCDIYLYIEYCTMYSVNLTVSTVKLTLYNVHFTMSTRLLHHQHLDGILTGLTLYRVLDTH